MVYWLFTEGRTLAQILLLPAACLTTVVFAMYILRAGVGVRQSERPSNTSPGMVRVAVHALFSLLVIVLFITLFSDGAVQRGRSTQSGIGAEIIGAPEGVDSRRLLLFAILLVGVVSIGLALAALRGRVARG